MNGGVTYQEMEFRKLSLEFVRWMRSYEPEAMRRYWDAWQSNLALLKRDDPSSKPEPR